MNVIGEALEELYRIFNILNLEKFDESLPEPVITIQKTKGNIYGHFTIDRVWKNKNHPENKDGSNEDSFYEINIDPRWFIVRSAVEITGTLLHEMVHYYNKINDIKDCSGNIHNKKFKTTAESVGLVVEHDKKVGWGYTSVNEELKEYIETIISPDNDVFEYFRSSVEKPKSKKKKTIFKYTCPGCGTVAKAKKDVSIMCGNCEIEMEMEKDLEDNE